MSVIGRLAADPDVFAAELDVLTDIPLPKPAARKHGDWRILLLPEHPVAKAQASIKRAIHGVGAAFEKAGARVDRTSDLRPDLVQQYGHYRHMLNAAMTRGAQQGSGDLREGQEGVRK